MKDLLKKLIPKSAMHAYYRTVEFLWALLYGFPARGMNVLAITGTKGKSSTAYLTSRVFEASGYKTALLSTIEFRVNGQSVLNDLKMTQPGRRVLQSFLRRARRAGCEYVIAEVTSEGIAQSRHRFLFARTALFTNLSPEHIESHGSFDAYKAAKRQLFREVSARARRDGTIVVNYDDPHRDEFMFPGAARTFTFGMDHRPAQPSERDLTAVLRERKPHVKMTVNKHEIELRLHGKYNIYNALGAMSLAWSEGISIERSATALAQIDGIPGRGEYIGEGQDFAVIVDYAHTADSLEKFYTNVRYHHKKGANGSGRMICVLGSAGGGRDKWRRPELGKLAARYCDVSVITNEDPYKENPLAIIDDVKAGADQWLAEHPPSDGREHIVETVADRREGIARAISHARAGDVVVITGKGSEQKLVTADGPIDWDDRKVAREVLRQEA